jgi:N-carbamoylputrescine amidase
MSDVVKVGAVATGPAGGDPWPLIAEAEAGIRAAAAAGARLVVLPELFAWPYAAGADPAHHPVPAEPIDGPVAAWAAGLARDLGVAILYGAALAEGPARPTNAALLTRADGSVTVAARKIHLPPAGPGDAFGEADHFEPGPPAIATFALGPVTVAALVCYDRRFPECWRAAAACGADLVAVLVAGPAAEDPPGFFLGELATHARGNAVYALAASRYGVETVLGYPVRHDGVTAGLDPNGAVVAAVADGAVGRADLVIDPARLAAARAANPTAGRLRLGHPAKPQEDRSASWES